MPLNGASCFLSRVRKCNRSPTVAPAASRLLRAGPSDFDSHRCLCALRPRVGGHGSRSKASSV